MLCSICRRFGGRIKLSAKSDTVLHGWVGSCCLVWMAGAGCDPLTTGPDRDVRGHHGVSLPHPEAAAQGNELGYPRCRPASARGSSIVRLADAAIALCRAEPRTTCHTQQRCSALAIAMVLAPQATHLALRQTEELIGPIPARPRRAGPFAAELPGQDAESDTPTA